MLLEVGMDVRVVLGVYGVALRYWSDRLSGTEEKFSAILELDYRSPNYMGISSEGIWRLLASVSVIAGHSLDFYSVCYSAESLSPCCVLLSFFCRNTAVSKDF